MMKGMLVFYQTYDDIEEGMGLVNSYRIGARPAVCILDPITG
jgi:hypothetical protein